MQDYQQLVDFKTPITTSSSVYSMKKNLQKQKVMIRGKTIMGKKKVVNEIERLYQRSCTSVLSFQHIMDNVDEKRSTLLGVLSSHPRLFMKLKKNVWKLIPAGVADLETICAEYGIDREKMESVMDDSGSLRYHWIRVQKEGDGFSRREIHYMIHTMRKDGKLSLPNSTQ